MDRVRLGPTRKSGTASPLTLKKPNSYLAQTLKLKTRLNTVQSEKYHTSPYTFVNFLVNVAQPQSKKMPSLRVRKPPTFLKITIQPHDFQKLFFYPKISKLQINPETLPNCITAPKTSKILQRPLKSQNCLFNPFCAKIKCFPLKIIYLSNDICFHIF